MPGSGGPGGGGPPRSKPAAWTAVAGREQALISALTEAVVKVYGQWAREAVVVHLDGVPAGRWGIGGRAVDDAAPAITFGIREAALARPDGRQVAARLVTGLTDAVAGVLGERARLVPASNSSPLRQDGPASAVPFPSSRRRA